MTLSRDTPSDRLAFELFLSTLPEASGAVVACSAASLWNGLVGLYKQAPLPVVLPATEDAQLEFRWETDRRLLSVEIMADGSYSWFFRDRETGEIQGTDDEPTTVWEPKIAELLELVA